MHDTAYNNALSFYTKYCATNIETKTVLDIGSLDVNGTINATTIIVSGSNITDIKWDNLINVPTTFITSNTLQIQNYINSNSIEDIVSFLISSNATMNSLRYLILSGDISSSVPLNK